MLIVLKSKLKLIITSFHQLCRLNGFLSLGHDHSQRLMGTLSLAVKSKLKDYIKVTFGMDISIRCIAWSKLCSSPRYYALLKAFSGSMDLYILKRFFRGIQVFISALSGTHLQSIEFICAQRGETDRKKYLHEQ